MLSQVQFESYRISSSIFSLSHQDNDISYGGDMINRC